MQPKPPDLRENVDGLIYLANRFKRRARFERKAGNKVLANSLNEYARELHGMASDVNGWFAGKPKPRNGA